MTKTGQVSDTRSQNNAPLRNLDDIVTAYQSASAQIGAASERLTDALSSGDDSDDLVAFARAVTEARDRLLGSERALAEYLLHRRGLRQRQTASLLSISLSTISRWSQTPEYFDRVAIDSEPDGHTSS
ncbi:MAG: hypothetical protein ACTHZ9_12105 [Leucobacter sp.]